jgi:hypothetical protein
VGRASEKYVVNATDLMQRIATTLREVIGPAIESEYPKTQAFMAAVVLQKLGKELALSAEHQQAQSEDLQALHRDLRARLANVETPPALLEAMERLASAPGAASLAGLVSALYLTRAELGEQRLTDLLGRVRSTLRADLDRRLEHAR